MQKLISTIFITLLWSTVCAQQKVDIDSQFDAIDVRGNVKVILNPSSLAEQTLGAVLEVEGIDVRKVKWKIENRVLNISAERGILEAKGKISLTVYVPNIKAISSKGATIVNVSTLKTKDLTIETLGATNKINIAIDVENLVVKSSGDADITISGATSNATIEAWMASRVDMIHCPAKNLYCKVNGFSEVYAQVIDLLDAKATTGATIYYMGNPTLKLKSSTFAAITPIE